MTVCGWVARRREHGEHLAFVDLRDHTGIIQCVIDHATDVRSEWVIAVTGTVRQRPQGTVNPGIGTGEVEIGDCTVEVLNEAEPPPFSVDDRDESDEPVRLKYRYVDLGGRVCSATSDSGRGSTPRSAGPWIVRASPK